MRVQPVEHGALQALNSVLQSIESVRNARALYLLLLAFAGAGLMMTLAQGALAREAGTASALWLAAAFFSLFYTSNAAGLHWDQATVAQRQASALSVNGLSWDGPAVVTHAPAFLAKRPAQFTGD